MHLTIFGKSVSHCSGSVPVVPSNILCTVQYPRHASDTFAAKQQSVKSCVIICGSAGNSKLSEGAGRTSVVFPSFDVMTVDDGPFFRDLTRSTLLLLHLCIYIV